MLQFGVTNVLFEHDLQCNHIARFLLLCHVDIAKASFTEWLTEIEVGDFPLNSIVKIIPLITA